ncbi:PREDICTED: LOW QUALITY PROTEIN: olfactory receptor 52A1-like [Nanorana parkeri]|uniref:LOW QUALITY PROTEIN: olfactory receptor 52A1-like n=1 Tax=Nanorana parkeri TaxID=125878 RepID=UPI0008546EC3|nr:PREDICTED: LOW QUALITY PROTEIN: olfactory receptor 52A1-like [Nanorana parkeri]
MKDIKVNATFYPTSFILVGIPGLEGAYNWVAAGVCFCWKIVLALLGNIMLLTIISASSVLHKPMFIFLSLLALNDTLLSTSIAPKMLSVFWFHEGHISFVSCLLQMFFLHSFCSFESGLLLGMAFDRYIAICQPLRYGSIITNIFIVRLVIIILLRAVALVGSCVVLINNFPAFKTNIVAHSYCEHMAIVKLAAADIRINSALGLTVAFTILGVDLMFILVSYCAIFHAVFRLPSKDARLKTFNTCIPHVCVFLSFHGLALFTFLSHRYGGKRIPPYVHIMLADTYLLVPPMLNPMIYGVKTKLIREQVWKMLQKYQSSLSKGRNL